MSQRGNACCEQGKLEYKANSHCSQDTLSQQQSIMEAARPPRPSRKVVTCTACHSVNVLTSKIAEGQSIECWSCQHHFVINHVTPKSSGSQKPSTAAASLKRKGKYTCRTDSGSLVDLAHRSLVKPHGCSQRDNSGRSGGAGISYHASSSSQREKESITARDKTAAKQNAAGINTRRRKSSSCSLPPSFNPSVAVRERKIDADGERLPMSFNPSVAVQEVRGEPRVMGSASPSSSSDEMYEYAQRPNDADGGCD